MALARLKRAFLGLIVFVLIVLLTRIRNHLPIQFQIENKLNRLESTIIEIHNAKVASYIKQLDTNRPLEPIELYDKIRCLKTSDVENISVHLCIHDLEKDFTSRMIAGYGIKETELLMPFIKFLKANLLKILKIIKFLKILKIILIISRI